VTGCLVVHEHKILLCRRSIEPASGLWNLPAGYLENGESVEQGALRETREEANAEAGIIRLHCVYSIPHVNQVYLIFLAGLPDGHFSPGKETSEVKLFGTNEIPWKDIGFTSSVFALEMYLESLGGSAKTTYVGQYRK
jgi:ADP-ribose pyrophosphatase YjhB (NUDIX family)